MSGFGEIAPVSHDVEATHASLVHDRSAAMDGGPPNEDHLAIGVRDFDGADLRDPDVRLVALASS